MNGADSIGYGSCPCAAQEQSARRSLSSRLSVAVSCYSDTNYSDWMGSITCILIGLIALMTGWDLILFNCHTIPSLHLCSVVPLHFIFHFSFSENTRTSKTTHRVETHVYTGMRSTVYHYGTTVHGIRYTPFQKTLVNRFIVAKFCVSSR